MTPLKMSIDYLINHDEMIQADRLEMDRPDPIMERGHRWVYKENICYFNIVDKDGKPELINIEFVGGSSCSFNYSEDMFEKLTEKF